MLAKSYPGYPHQKAAHDELIQQVVDLRTRFLEGEAVMTMDVMRFLKDWLTGHILGEDMELGAYVNSRTAADR